MRAELQNKLIGKYPDLFKDRFLGMQSNLMCFGCECSDGWYKLLDTLFNAITNHYKNNVEQECPTLIQVKEKYGELRVYLSHEDEYTSGMLSMAEDISLTICEECGAPGQPNYYDDNGEYIPEFAGWVRTRCKEHKGDY